MGTVVIGNNKFNKDKEENKFKLAKVLFYNLGYNLELDDNNHLVCTKILNNKNELSKDWYIDSVSFDSITLIKNNALITFDRSKDIENANSFYKYFLGLANITKFTEEDLARIDSIIGSTFLYILNVSGN